MRLLLLFLTSISANDWFESFHSLAEIRSFYSDLAEASDVIEIITDEKYPEMFAVLVGGGGLGQSLK